MAARNQRPRGWHEFRVQHNAVASGPGGRGIGGWAGLDQEAREWHSLHVSTLTEIERAIEQLPSDEFRELRRWMQDRDASQWDAEIAAHDAAGKFDELRRQVRSSLDSGACKDL
jgi:hypothetical protein